MSAGSHAIHRNIDWRLVGLMAPAGVAGGVVGTYLLTGVDGDAIKPYVTAYLAAIGAYILFKAYRRFPERPVSGLLVLPLGGVGGFADAVGGGGWGPVVTSSLIGSGGNPRMVVGSVNAVEFAVTASVSLAFLAAMVTGHWSDAGDLTEHASAVAGLIVGGVVAAPLAGFAIKALPGRVLTPALGTLIVALAAYQAWSLL